MFGRHPDRGCFVYERRRPANLVTPVYSSVMQMRVTIAFLWRRPSLPSLAAEEKKGEKSNCLHLGGRSLDDAKNEKNK